MFAKLFRIAIVALAAPGACVTVDQRLQEDRDFEASVAAMQGASERDVVNRLGAPTESYDYTDGARQMTYRYQEYGSQGDQYVCNIVVELDPYGTVSNATVQGTFYDPAREWDTDACQYGQRL